MLFSHPSALPQRYLVKRTGNIVMARIHGEWSTAITLNYFHALSEEIRQIQGQPWGALIDMRGWRLEESVVERAGQLQLDVDRRNQVVECWIVDHPEQAEELARLPRTAGIPLHRVADIGLAYVCLRGRNLQPDGDWIDLDIPIIE